MKTIKIIQLSFFALLAIIFLSCNSNENNGRTENAVKTTDTFSYPYKASYSSDVVVPGNHAYLQMVLTVWKMFETAQIGAMKKYYADTVTYDPGNGSRFHGKVDDLLSYAAKDIEGLDSLRFDLSMWQSVHINDRNEDWVYIWATERRYPKTGTPDTSLIHEQWQISKGKVVYFNKYNATPVRSMH